MTIDTIMLLFGISGVIAIALNFILEATNKLKKDHHNFALLNIYGSTVLFAYSWYQSVWLFVVLNGFLMLIGFYGLWKVFK
jgi:hypothetical protein